MLIEAAPYLLLGAFVGLLAGLLGVGGGLIIVPVLSGLFIAQGIHGDIVMHLALGTSLASILATSISSVYSHHRKGAVLWPAAFRLTPGILLGAWSGGMAAGALSSELLRPIFASFELVVALYMLLGSRPHTHQSHPSATNYSISGTVIGFISSIVGIGGGTMTVPWLVWHGRRIHQAIATSAAVGFPIALAGALSYLVAGWQHVALPAQSLGFIYLPALLGIILSSMLFAPLGAALAHRLDVGRLRKLFAFLLLGLSAYLFAS